MPVILLVRTMLKSVGVDKVQKERKFRIEADNLDSPSFSRELYSKLFISSDAISSKKKVTIGSKEWTRIVTKKSRPVYWEYRVLGPGEADMSEHFSHDHLAESRTLPK